MAKPLDWIGIVVGSIELVGAGGATAVMLWTASPFAARQQPAPTPSFRSGVDLVRVSAVVRDARGQFVRGLSPADFEVLDGGVPRPIIDFELDRPAVSLAILIDVSGSMADRIDGARQSATDLLEAIDPLEDEAAIFTFDSRLNEIEPFTPGLRGLPRSLATLSPFGATSLHDAIAATARRLVDRGSLRRAIVVFTDGSENWSRLSAAEASIAASAIDVPVYIVGIVPDLERPSPGTVAALERSMIDEALSNLATGTGGRSFTAYSASDRLVVADQILEELRHQYLIAFEADRKPGWHGVVVRARKKELVVRARNGYNAGQSRPIS